MCNSEFIIIGGTTKAGTTSLFNYLGDHPQICKAELKETRFFLDDDHPLKKTNSKNESLDDYLRLFHCDDSTNVKLEATPDYLYAADAPDKIAGILGQFGVKMIFILRNPVDRFISWYKFAMQDGKIDSNTTLKDYFRANINSKSETDPQYLKALERGFYSKFIPSFVKSLGAENVKIIYFEDLTGETISTLKSLSIYAGIKPEFYGTYQPKIYNKTVKYKYPVLNNAYKKSMRYLRERLVSAPHLKDKLEVFKPCLRNIYHYINPKDKKDLNSFMKEEHINEIKKYYDKEIKLYNNRNYV